MVFPRAYAADARKDRARRAALTGKFPHAITDRDLQIGALLKAAGVAYSESSDGTGLVVFVGQGEGGTSSERSIRVPVALRYPGVLEPRVSSGILVSTVDLVPTVLALCNVAPPEGLQGRDLSQLLLRQSGELPESVYVQGESWRVVIRGYDKLITDLSGAPERLFNLADDPKETTDLVHDPRFRLTRDALGALGQIWKKKLSDRIEPSVLKQR